MNSSGIDSEKKSDMVSESSNPETLFSTKTPDKSAILPTRSRDRDVTVSLPEIKPQGSQNPTKPVKRQILSSPQKPEIPVKLPERLEILEKLFNGLDTAIRLLKLKRSPTSFANICPKIEFLTNRVFSYDHLAQMKHLYPEAIEVKRVLKYDECTSCMKPSLHINLNTDVIVLDDTSCGTKYMELRKVFHSKLVDFYKAHPKDEIPKELLPEPFSSFKSESYSDIVNVELGPPKLEAEAGEFDVLMEEVEQEENVVEKGIQDSTLSAGTEESESLVSHTESIVVGTPVKDLSTPSKDILSTPIRLMSATPTLQPSRRCITMTPDEDNDSVRSTKGLERLPSRTRCLNFDTLEEDESVGEGINDEADDVSLLNSMKETTKEEPGKQNILKLVDVIHKLFHSTKRTIITKEELLHKIIACQINITDRREVEEQLKLMLQLVPDWISETKASSGDSLFRINKMSTVEMVHGRLEEATSQSISTVR